MKLLPSISVLVATLITLLTLNACGQAKQDSHQHKLALEAVANGALLVDVRSAEEVKSGALVGAINIPHTAIVPGLAAQQTPKDQPIVLYCRSGNRSGKAAAALKEAGYTQVINGGAYEDLRALQSAQG